MARSKNQIREELRGAVIEIVSRRSQFSSALSHLVDSPMPRGLRALVDDYRAGRFAPRHLDQIHSHQHGKRDPKTDLVF